MDGNVPCIAALEDKIVQQAVVTALNQIYEEDFLGFSYGFRKEDALVPRLGAADLWPTQRRYTPWWLFRPNKFKHF
jgi:hypothetical protein